MLRPHVVCGVKSPDRCVGGHPHRPGGVSRCHGWHGGIGSYLPRLVEVGAWGFCPYAVCYLFPLRMGARHRDRSGEQPPTGTMGSTGLAANRRPLIGAGDVDSYLPRPVEVGDYGSRPADRCGREIRVEGLAHRPGGRVDATRCRPVPTSPFRGRSLLPCQRITSANNAWRSNLAFFFTHIVSVGNAVRAIVVVTLSVFLTCRDYLTVFWRARPCQQTFFAQLDGSPVRILGTVPMPNCGVRVGSQASGRESLKRYDGHFAVLMPEFAHCRKPVFAVTGSAVPTRSECRVTPRSDNLRHVSIARAMLAKVRVWLEPQHYCSVLVSDVPWHCGATLGGVGLR